MYTAMLITGDPLDVGDELIGGIFAVKAAQGHQYFDTLQEARKAARMAAKYVSANVSIVDENFRVVAVYP